MRLLIVSNRLPITVTEKDGKLRFQQSPGGLVSGLSAYLDSLKSSPFAKLEHLWIGWPGIAVEDKEKLRLKAPAQFHAYPVFLSEEAMERFYHGFCNKIIWPLFHYFPSYAVYDEDYWVHYTRVNETFCDAVMEIVKPGDVVWVHDYHLMLLPKLLRKKMPSLPIGFFLHIPFPVFEVFRLLPAQWRREILEGLLGADLIGFHTHDYTQYFLKCVLRILGYEHDMGRIMTGDHMVKVDTFPMGIGFQRFHNAVNSPEIQREIGKLKKTLADFRVILSVDRLDYTKGISNRLQGYEVFLEKNPQWHKRVILVLVVVPSRIGVEHYQQMKRQIDELVGKINGRFGSVHWTPILYQYKFLPFQPLVALYSISDIALITPLRDGMNLVAKEYVAARTDKTGVLILSEMAGASKELGEAIIINPNNTEEIANALKEALEMPEEEQVKRNQAMRARLERYDVVRWADDFIQALLSIKEMQKRLDARLLGSKARGQLIKDFNGARRRLIFLDYDGTLVPLVDTPQKAKPTEELLQIIKRLSEDHQTEIVLISGRAKDTLEIWFGMLNVGLVAEHGAWLKEKNGDWRMLKPLANDWRSHLLPLLETYVDRLPGSFIEEKEFAIAWHYRKADPELGPIRANELMDDLVSFTANIDVQVLQGNKVVEIRNAGVNKGAAGLCWISKDKFDFIMATGDDWTDEELFRILPEAAYSIRVGMTQSHARFNLHNHAEVLNLIMEIIK
ncbi:MAG: bifunctional alpha,alpha-trehalose-phosphate synthase (UDP-forming)/trehalose-phosphatase [Chloroflexi bacterium]|nr:bifunctional alpha,alpha-trehalose-phosphate synthase (UDP-forming)/trehalose-phosphatase [Chloroflexota bacterium]